ncbi:MAG: antitoxin [Clostridia bacterium]|nr:antitoxin [Clostridia bacterium]
MPKKQTEWTRAYNEKAYDRLAVTIPKGRKTTVEEHAQRMGLSVNGLVNQLLRTELGLSEENWKHADEQ